MNFFFDANISKYIARMLNAYDNKNNVTHLYDDDRFESNTPDIQWISAISKDVPKPVIITGDRNITKNLDERIALKEASITAIFVRPHFFDVKGHEQAVKFLKVWPLLVGKMEQHTKPAIFEMNDSATKIYLM